MKNYYKLWIVLSLIVVFIAGVICGVLIDKNMLNKPKHDSRRRRSTRFPTIEIMAKELSLSSEQQAQIKEIFQNNEERFKSLRKDMDNSLKEIRAQLLTDIKSVLSDEQKTKFEAMIEKYRSQRKREHEEWKRRQEKSDRKRGEKDKGDRDKGDKHTGEKR
jgi:Spy/CpxP family protein refolding chaperone